MAVVSIRELKQNAGPVPTSEAIHAQLEVARQKTTKTGNPFYELHFVDAEETLILRIWNDSPMFSTCAQLQAGQFYELSGEFGLGNDGRSIDSKRWEVRALNGDEAAALLAGSGVLREKQAADYAFIENAVNEITDPRLKHLCVRFLDSFGERFRRTGAARDYHHARRGGLVEHVSQMMRSAIQICEAYQMLNRDLLVAGVLFHDVGKLWENVYAEKGFTMPYSEVSELIGHIPMGMEIVNKIWRELKDDEAVSGGWRDLQPPSERVRLHLLHLIASHHGELAFGSPVVPKTPEAQALHYIDNLDAKMEMFERGYLVASELAKNVYERVRPLPGRLVGPLPQVEGVIAEPTPEPEMPQFVAEEPAFEPEPEPISEESVNREQAPASVPEPEYSPPAENQEEAPSAGDVIGDGLPIPLPEDDNGERPDPF